MELLVSGTDPVIALNSGYRWAFFTGAIFAAGAAILGALFLRMQPTKASADEARP